MSFSVKFILFLLLTWSIFPIVFGQTTTVSVSPSSVTSFVGQNFSINVTVSDVSDPSGLYGWEFVLTWNSTLLTVVNVTEGLFLESGGGSTFFFNTVNATYGSVQVDDTLTGNVNGVDGGGTLATITFYVNNAGACALHLSEATLVDSQDLQIQCQTADANGNFSVPPDIAVTAVNVSPITLLAGGIVSINVTVQNQGSSGEDFNVTVYANSQTIGEQPVSLPINSISNLSFTWNTAGLEQGDYAIIASASVVPGEMNTTNNSMQAANNVTLLYNGHDVAVIAAGPSKTVVFQGYTLSVAAIVKDYGIFSETFNTTIYANTTALYKQTVDLQSGTWATLSYTWSTSGFAMSNYTISAYATPVPGETDTSNNNYTGGWITVSLVGDITGRNGWPDGNVDMKDIAYVAARFGTTPSSPNWNPNCDVNDDGKVDMKDVAIVAAHFGDT